MRHTSGVPMVAAAVERLVSVGRNLGIGRNLMVDPEAIQALIMQAVAVFDDIAGTVGEVVGDDAGFFGSIAEDLISSTSDQMGGPSRYPTQVHGHGNGASIDLSAAPSTPACGFYGHVSTKRRVQIGLTG